MLVRIQPWLLKKKHISIWLDDERSPPPGWVWVKSFSGCLVLMKGCRRLDNDKLAPYHLDRISLDHDLGSNDWDSRHGRPNTGYDLAVLIEMWAHDGSLLPCIWGCHSMNPVGRANIQRALRKADQFWVARYPSWEPESISC
jgi:hypothetical protein